MSKPAVPHPSKLRKAADQLLPASGLPEDEKPAVPQPRARLVGIVDQIDFKAPDNLTSTTADKWKDLNFKVDEQYHRRIKQVAANWGMSMKELLEAAMQNWIDSNGDSPRTVQDYERLRDERKRRA